MDANLYTDDPIPSAEQPQHLVDIPSPSIDSDVASTCVHIREEDSHCEQCRQQIRSMSRSMLQQPSQLALPATLDRESIDPCYAVANTLRQRRRASHFPSASDSSMSSLFSSSPPEDITSSVPADLWRESRGSRRPPTTQSKRRDSPAFRSLTNILNSSRNVPAPARSRSNQSFSAA
jgi:hypothetical protein